MEWTGSTGPFQVRCPLELKRDLTRLSEGRCESLCSQFGHWPLDTLIIDGISIGYKKLSTMTVDPEPARRQHVVTKFGVRSIQVIDFMLDECLGS
jgi:hypothetical protein